MNYYYYCYHCYYLYDYLLPLNYWLKVNWSLCCISSYISSHMQSQTACRSFIGGRTELSSTTISGLLTFLPKKERFEYIRFWLFFTFFFVSTKIVMNPQVVLLLLLVAVPCTSASMLLLPFCNVYLLVNRVIPYETL